MYKTCVYRCTISAKKVYDFYKSYTLIPCFSRRYRIF